MDESRDSIAFATEPLIGSLANVLSTTAAASASTASTTTPNNCDAFDLDELEIQKGLLQLFRALAFCHQDARMLHGNLSPSTVFINAKGDFKLGGFAFSRHLSIDEVVDYHYEYELPTAARPMLDYLAPENVMERKASCKSDVFALACVIHALFNRGQPALMRSRDNVATYRVCLNHTLAIEVTPMLHSRQSLVERLYSVDLSRCPPALRDTLKRMLHRDPTIRPSIKEIQTSPYFDNLLVSTIKFMESMVEQMPAQKMAFFKGLPKILPQFPRRTLVAKVYYMRNMLFTSYCMRIIPHISDPSNATARTERPTTHSTPPTMHLSNC